MINSSAMYLTELFTRSDDIEGYRSGNGDESRAKKNDTRKTRLTLAHINNLRKMNDARTVEREDKIKKVQDQYKIPVENGDAGGMF